MAGAVEAGRAVIKAGIEADKSSVAKAGKDVEKELDLSLKNIGSATSRAGRAATVGLTTPIIGAGAGLVKLAADFEREMIRVGIATGGTDEELQKLGTRARELGSSTVFSAKESAEAMSALGRAGFSTDEIFQSIEGTLGLAATEQMDLGRAAEITAAAIQGMGLEADQAGRVADVLATGSIASLASVEGLGNALGYSAGQANLAGLSIEQTVGALSAMSDAGIDASRSGTALNNMIASLSNPTDKLGEALARFNVETLDADGNLRDIEDIFKDVGEAGPTAIRDISQAMEKNAGRAFVALGQRARDTDSDLFQLIDQMEDAGHSTGVLANAAEVAVLSQEELKTAIEGTVKQASKAGLEIEEQAAALITLSDAGLSAEGSTSALNSLLKNIRKPTEDMSAAMEKAGVSFRDADGKMRDMTDVFEDIGKLGPEAIQSIASSMEGEAGQAFTVLAQKAQDGEQDLSALADSIGNTEGAAKQMGDALTGGTSGAIEELSSSLEGLALAVADSGLLEFFTDIIKQVTDMVRNFSEAEPETFRMVAAFAAVAAGIGPLLVALGAVISAIGSIAAVVGPVAGAIAGIATAPVSVPLLAIAAALVAIGVGLKTAYDQSEPFRNFVNGLLGQLQAFGSGFIDGFLGAFEEMKPFFEEEIMPTLQEVGDFFTFIGQQLERFFVFIQPAIDAAIPVFQKFGEIMGRVIGSGLVRQIQGVIKIFQGLFKIIVKPIQAIALLITGDLEGSFEAFMEYLEGFKDVFFGIINGIFGGIIELIKSIFQIASPSKVLLDIAENVVQGFIDGIKAMLNSLTKMVTRLATTVINGVTKLIVRMLEFGRELLRRFVLGITRSISLVVGAFLTIRRKIIDAIRFIVGLVRQDARQIVTALVGAIRDRLSRVADIGRRIKDRIVNALSGIRDRMFNLGRDLVNGLIGGISNLIGSVANKAREMANSVVGAVKGIFQSQSPSKVMISEGENVGDGLAIGLLDSKGKVARAGQEMSSAALTGTRSGGLNVSRADGGSVTGGRAGDSVIVNQNYYGPTTSNGRLREIDWTIRYATKARNFRAAGMATV